MPNQISNVSFSSPYAAEQMDIQRKQKLAALLQQQAMTPSEQPVTPAGGFTPRTGIAQGLAKVMQMYAGQHGEKEAMTKQEALSQRMQQERQQALAQAMMQGQGSPQPAPEQGGGPAMPPNPMGAAQTLAGANDPALQQAGLGMLGKQLEDMTPQRPMNPQDMAFKEREHRYTEDFRASESAANRAAREQQADAQRVFQETQAAAQRQQQLDMAKFTLANRQPQQQQVIQTADGPMTVGPNSTARPIMGPGKPARMDAADNVEQPATSGSPIKAPPRASANRPMSATVQKELIQTEEEIQGARSAADLIKQAQKVNKNAMGFMGAGAVANVGTLLPNALKPKTIDATLELDNLITGSALPQLKSIFGGMPTEGERKILLDLQGSSAKPASVREGIFNRAQQAVERRIKFNSDKAKQLRAGTYFQEQSAPEAPAAGVDDLLEKYK